MIAPTVRRGTLAFILGSKPVPPGEDEPNASKGEYSSGTLVMTSDTDKDFSEGDFTNIKG